TGNRIDFYKRATPAGFVLIWQEFGFVWQIK
ncbi:MAG: hypothetical protein H6Q69_1419, partial [Firmicutes bacterium]|nr:hypothetical protein [Bacillota bacterium]